MQPAYSMCASGLGLWILILSCTKFQMHNHRGALLVSYLHRMHDPSYARPAAFASCSGDGTRPAEADEHLQIMTLSGLLTLCSHKARRNVSMRGASQPPGKLNLGPPMDHCYETIYR